MSELDIIHLPFKTLAKTCQLFKNDNINARVNTTQAYTSPTQIPINMCKKDARKRAMNCMASSAASFCFSALLVLGHVLGLTAAEWSMDIFDFYPECIFENDFNYVNGDWSDALVVMSWAGIICAILLFTAALMRNGGGVFGGIFYCVLCLYAMVYVAWAVVLVYIICFFSYVYFEATHLVHTCGGLVEIREVWWISVAALILLLPACCGCCVFFVKGRKQGGRRSHS